MSDDKYQQELFERYSEQLGYRDFEEGEPDYDGRARYRNPNTQGRWNFWVASRDALSTPSAVTPAVPSEIELQHREALDCLDSVMRAASHVLVGLAPSEKEAKLRSVLSKAHDWCMAERAALSQTMQPQASAIEWPDDAELEAWRSTADDLLRSLPNLRGAEIRSAAHLLQNAYLFASRAASAQQAEPAAGEQAGAVADEQLDAAHKRFQDYIKWSKEDDRHRIEHSHDYYEREAIRAALAAPGAAIAAREQEGTTAKVRTWHDRIKDEHPKSNPEYWLSSLKVKYMEAEILDLRTALASREEARATPQGEAAGLSEVTERYCNKCGYFGPDQIHYRPNGLGECGYIARIRTQPTTVQQADALGLLRRSEYFVSAYADRNPKWDWDGTMQDPSSVHALLAEIRAAPKGMQPGERKEGA